jgi:TolB-like protein/tetratricopeptide (TPR) repeat protein
MRLSAFLSELKRRRVFRVGGVYIVAAFAALQSAQLLIDALHLPGWLLTGLTMLVLVALPIVLALAWVFDWTPEGVRRTEGALPQPARAAGRPRAGGIAVVGAVTILALAAGAFVTFRSGSGADPRRVAVTVFENQTGDASLEPLGRMAADWITRSLTEARVFEVADAPSFAAPDGAVPGQDAGLLWAGQSGAGTVVSGSYYRQGDTLLVTARIRDIRRGKVLREVGPVRAPVDEPLRAVERLGGMIAGGLAAILDADAPTMGGAGRQPPEYEAYRAFLEGEDAFYRAEYEDAIRHYHRATEIDPLYVGPILREAAAHNNHTGACAPILAAARALAAAGARPSEYEQQYLASMEARCRGDAEAGYRAGRRMTELAPGSEWTAYYAALGAINSGRVREGVDALQRLDPARGFLARVALYHLWLARGLHRLGEYEEELEAIERGRLQHPGHSDLHLLDLRALAALGRGEELRRRLSELSGTLADTDVRDVMSLAEELSWHDRPEMARSLAERVLERTERGAGRLRGLVAAGRIGQASALADSLAAAGASTQPDHAQGASAFSQPGASAQLGHVEAVLAAWLGDSTAAAAALQALGDAMGAEMARVEILTRLGRRQEAVRELRRLGPRGFDQAHARPALEPLRGYPPFEALLRQRD